MLNVKGSPYRSPFTLFAVMTTDGECIHTFLNAVLIVGQLSLTPCIVSTMVPVAVYWGTPVKRRYLQSGGNVDTINNAVQVGKDGTEKKVVQRVFYFRKLNLFSYL